MPKIIPLDSPAPRSTPAAVILRSLLIAAIVALAIALSVRFGVESASASIFPASLVPALFVGITVVAAIVLIRVRMDRLPLRGIGLTGARPLLASFALGLCVVLGFGLLAFGISALFGIVEITGFDPLRLVTFLAINTILALLFEAIPEELALRGYVLTSLRARFSRGASTVLSLVIFMLMALFAGLFIAILDGAPLDLAPSNQDPITYYLTLVALGLMVVFAREASFDASIGACIGVHLAFLTVSRVLLGGSPNTGLDVSLTFDGQAIIFAGTVTLGVIALSLLRWRQDVRRSATA